MQETSDIHLLELCLAGDRDAYGQLKAWLDSTPPEHFNTRRSQAELLFRRIGITFAVYGEGGSPDRLIPFDMFPRIFAADEWDRPERGIKQRARALNCFLADVSDR